MREDVLEERQRAALHALGRTAYLGFYLAGGTALCMYLEHRRSFDLDLFRAETFDADEMIRTLREAGVRLEDITTSRGTVHAAVEGVRTSLLTFPYPLVGPLEKSSGGLPLASLPDIAAMKIEAIASRGARKDFYDLYFVCQAGLSFGDAMKAFEEKFASAHPDRYHRLRAMTYFDDAEHEPLPNLLRPVEWADVRAFFERSAAEAWRAGLAP